MFKKLFSHSFLYAIGPQLPKFAGLILLPILTKFLTPVDYAIYGTALAYVGALTGLRDLGFQQTIVNAFFKAGKNRKRWIGSWRQQMGILYLWGIPFALLLALVLYLSMQKYVGDRIVELILLYVIPVLFFDVINMIGFRFFQLSQKPLWIAVVTIISGVVSLAVNYYTIVYLNLHYWGFFLAAFSGSMISALLFFFPIFIQNKIYPLFYFKRLQFTNYCKVALPTIPHAYSSYLLNASDRVMLDLYGVPTTSIGLYNFAYTIGNYADQVGSAVGQAISPFYLSEYAKRNKEGYQRAKLLTIVLQVVFASTTILGCLWLKEIFDILSSNEALALSFPVGIIILMSYAFRPMYWAVVSRLGYEEKTKYLWRISFIGGILNVVLNIILIPIYGIYGAAISTFIGLLYIGFAGYYLNAFKKMNTENYYPLRWLIFFCITMVGVYIIRDVGIPIKILLTAGIFVILGILVKKFMPQLKFLSTDNSSL